MDAMPEEALRESACETLENLAFTELVPEAEAVLPEPGERVCARIGLGPDGELDVVLSQALLSEIATILFNLEAEPDAGILQDALLEIANIIAGRYLEKRHGDRSDFVMGLPSACEQPADWSARPLRMAMAAGPGRLLALALNAREGMPP